MSFRSVRFTHLPGRLLGVAALVATSVQCAQLIGLDEFFDCPGDLRCPAPDGGTPPAPTCTDGVKNGNESDKDCGGSCPACAIGRGCDTGADCASQVCGPGRTCLGPGCTDQLKNGDETDVDCGGTCGTCAPGKGCNADVDCTTKSCVTGKCVPTCTDGMRDGSETDVDCGGGAVSGCSACIDDQGCGVNGDCSSGICQASHCVAYHEWSKHLSALTSPWVAGDSGGGSYLAGNFTGAIDFGNGALMSAGGADVGIARFDASGNAIWSKRFGGPANQWIGGLAAQSTSEVVLAGSFSGDLGLGAPLTATGPLGSTFVAAFDQYGTLSWRRGYGGSGSHGATTVAVDAQSLIAIGGVFSGNPDFGSGSVMPQDDVGLYVAMLGFDGKAAWAKGFSCVNSDPCVMGQVAFDPSGNVIATGGYWGATVDLGGGPLPDSAGMGVFVVKLAADGTHLWSRGYPTGEDFAAGYGVAADGGGNVVVTGLTYGTIDFGGGTLNQGAFLLKLDSSGNHRWSRAFSPGVADVGSGRSVAIDSAGNISIAGYFAGKIDLGGGPLASVQMTNDVFVAKLDPAGNHIWSKRFGGTEDDLGYSLALVAPQEIVVAGNFGGLVDFGGGMLASQSPDDLFLARFRTP